MFSLPTFPNFIHHLERLRKALPAVTSLIVLLSTSAASAQTFQSGVTKANLIELYTSEGCSSCPPADNWFSSLKEHPKLWQKFVPVAFHVDYWDWIGWKDEFAKPGYGERQKDYRSKGNTRSVYTPGFFVNGREWRDFFSQNGKPKIPFGDAQGGFLEATLLDQKLSVKYQPVAGATNKSAELHANIALLAFNESNFIKWGENIGKSLHHDFIAVELKQVALSINQDNVYTANLNQLKIPPPQKGEKKDNQYALAIWVSDGGTLNVLQATGGWLQQTND